MKKLVLQILFLTLFAILSINSIAQNNSRLRISLLTCAPGQELSETFGHSAFRVIDSNAVTDHVYNYGIFPFYEKGFYLKFMRGKLKYSVEVEQFEDFKQNYLFQNRSIREQILHLSETEKKEIYHYLLENIKEENKYYQYDFFLDNCTTRLRDIVKKYHKPSPTLPAVMPTYYTFRNAIHQYLDYNNAHWSKFGIDILLGARTDAVMTIEQQEFLPDNLMRAFDSTKNTSLVLASQNIFLFEKPNKKSVVFTPLICTTLFLFLFIFLNFYKNNTRQKILKKLDFFLFFIVGLLGILLVFMWLGTDHSMTKDNYNLLWAWPIFVVYAFYINKNSKSVKTFSVLVLIYMILLLCSWFFLPQQMNNGLLPVLVLMAWRSGKCFFNIK
ncbi:MAG: DUF4105 domain-containing protein [Ferruginibacter sp.]|nr:DUF4105 domain-containing protein [Ferruginibacter sp.]